MQLVLMYWVVNVTHLLGSRLQVKSRVVQVTFTGDLLPARLQYFIQLNAHLVVH